ncbi:MAG: hypothetical protein IJ326_01725 [Lachnospiraceae bacterium]|nr:hypothetical protein [Lachnospiraceae bacterium]
MNKKEKVQLTDEQMEIIEQAEQDGKNIVRPLVSEEIFNNVEFITQGSLKLMDGKFGGAFYVKFLQDYGSKRGWLELIIVYPDGQYKRVTLCKNVMKETELGNENMVVISQKEKNGEKKNVMPRLKQSMEYGSFYELERYDTPQMPIPSKTIWKQIIEHYEKIPNEVVSVTVSFEEIYEQLYEIALRNNAIDINGKFVTDTRFIVTKEEMEKTAKNNNMKLSELRVELSRRGLLVTDKGSTASSGKRYQSYQFTIKVDGKNERYYAIKRGITPKRLQKVDESISIPYTEVL